VDVGDRSSQLPHPEKGHWENLWKLHSWIVRRGTEASWLGDLNYCRVSDWASLGYAFLFQKAPETIVTQPNCVLSPLPPSPPGPSTLLRATVGGGLDTCCLKHRPAPEVSPCTTDIKFSCTYYKLCTVRIFQVFKMEELGALLFYPSLTKMYSEQCVYTAGMLERTKVCLHSKERSSPISSPKASSVVNLSALQTIYIVSS
jgi:hypothetical protein